jgi:hypothetical protein
VHRYLQEETKFVQAKTKALAENMIRSRGDYRPPEQLTVDLNEQRRRDKIAMEEERAKLVKEVKYDLPKASKQKVDAIVFKLQQERKHIQEIVPDDPELTLRPDTSKTLRVTAQRKYYHTGKWQKSAFSTDEPEEEKRPPPTGEKKDSGGKLGESAAAGKNEKGFSWSCCMSGDRDSEGCVAYKYDKSRWILSGFN